MTITILQRDGFTWTLTRGNWHLFSGQVPSLLKAGTTKIRKVTSAEAGFPGSANMNFLPAFVGMLANVVGFPGFIATRPKWIVPLNLRSITGLSRSLAPIDVPPVVKRISAVSRPCDMARTWASTLITPHIRKLQRAQRVGLTYQRRYRGLRPRNPFLPMPSVTMGGWCPIPRPNHHPKWALATVNPGVRYLY